MRVVFRGWLTPHRIVQSIHADTDTEYHHEGENDHCLRHITETLGISQFAYPGCLLSFSDIREESWLRGLQPRHPESVIVGCLDI